ncbi:hypothetical protein C8024_02695 [Sphingopyxis sp. BSNA05]|nr:hypothetical protein [Sphingopyxis sp. BSNA05]
MEYSRNAVKFTSSGSVSVSATAKQAAADKMEMQVMVRDTGIGIPSNRLEAISRRSNRRLLKHRRYLAGAA